ncbi:MAG: aldo/keto reductase [Chitinophagaceae bacterium]|nr:aldo/keto reductase [Chitinophagaceae bacterium]HMN33323.1 aldo/keto reductase [Chitinophagaceae bacterium]
MQYRYLGKSGLQLSVLSLGSWISFSKQINEKTAAQLMAYAYDEGVNFFDNAEVYAHGESEKMMGKILKKQKWDRTTYCISSKVFFGWHGKENKPNQMGLSRKHIVEACHEALQRFQTDYLDLYFCHRPDKNTPIEETVLTMNHLIQQGKILYWGTSEWSGVEIMEAHRVAAEYKLIGPIVEQPQYNLFVREKIENEFSFLYDTVGLGTTVWSPLASGLLSGKYNNNNKNVGRMHTKGFEWLAERWLQNDKLKKVEKLAVLAQELGVTLPQLSIAWCIQNKRVTSAILGATKKEQLAETFQSIELIPKLTQEVNGAIDKIMKNKPIHSEF